MCALDSESRARGATIYVTLEPCSTHGRTPPCTDAIRRAGFARVVIGATDPNPRHAGKAMSILEAAGIAVRAGVLSAECETMNRAFNKWIVTGRPWVIAKAALTLDGRLTRPPGEDRWLSGPAARRRVHQLRVQVDAILIGAGTLRTDNPRLTVRDVPGADPQRQPWRVVLTRGGDLPAEAHLFTDQWRERTLVYQRRTLRQVLVELGRREVTSVLIEGGGQILGQAFAGGHVDEVQFFLTPWLVAGPVSATAGKRLALPPDATLCAMRSERLAQDVLVTGLITRTRV